MKRNDAFGVVMRTIIIVALAFVWIAGAIPAYGSTTQPNPTSEDLTTGYSSTQAQQFSSLGFSTAQPSREDQAGNIIDKKTDTPLGPNMLVENQTFQIAGAGLNIDNDPYDIYNLSLQRLQDLGSPSSSQNTAERFNDLALLHTTGNTSDWYDAPKAMVGADLDGSGKDDLVTVALPNNSQTKHCSLEIIVTSYDSAGTSRTGSTILENNMTVPRQYTNSNVYPIHVAAGDFNHDPSGKDEVAVAVGNTLYVARVSVSPTGPSTQTVSATLLWSTVYDQNNPIATVSNASKDFPKMDLAAADTNDDGYKDLLVTTGSSDGGVDGHIPQLLIYSDTPSVTVTTAPNPIANIPLSLSSNEAFVSPSVAVGDIFGTGVKDVVIAGKTETNGKINRHQASLTYITYVPTTKSYDQTTLGNPIYSLNISSNDPIKYYVDDDGMTGLAIASLDGPVGPQFVACGDHVFQYDASSLSFVDQNVKVKVGLGILKKNHKAYMLDIVAGNFIGSSIGTEQIAMLYTGSKGTKLTLIGEFSPGTRDIVSTTLGLDSADYPAVCAPDVLNNGIKYTYDKSEFTFTDPTVIALLAATPYYKGLQYPPAQGNVGTSFGTGSGTETEKSNGIQASVGITFGFTQDINVIVNIGEVKSETKVEGSITADWSQSESVEKSISYNNYVGNADNSADSVVIAVVPEDIYFYKVVDEANSDTKEWDIAIPYPPETTIMPVTDYDSKVSQDQISDAPYIDTAKVLDGAQPGNPASYPSSVNVTPPLSNVDSSSGTSDSGETGSNVSSSLSTVWNNWFGSISSSGSIITSNSSSSSNNVGNIPNTIPNTITPGQFAGSGIGNNSETQKIEESTSSSTSVGGSISVTQEVEGDLFGASFGSSVSAGYSHSTQNTKSHSVTFEGSVAGVPEGYDQYQFQWELVVYNYNLTAGKSTQKIAVVSYLVQPLSEALPPVAPQNFKVDSVSPTSATLQWDPVYAGANPVGYHVLRSSTMDGSYKTVKTFSPTSGNVPVKWKDTSLQPNGTYYYKVEAFDGSPEVDGQPTSSLTVQTSGALTLKVDFKVGTTDNATALVPNEPLVATAAITNNLDTTQNVIFLTTLYDANGAMVSEAHKAVTISANSTSNAQVGFTLPADVTSATVAAFLWDGTDLKSSSLVPLSNVVTIGS